MASTEEFKKLECFINVNNEQEKYCLILYKQYDAILNNKSQNFEKKVQSLIDVWKNIADLNTSKCNIKSIIEILDWAKLHVLNIVLTGEWRFAKDHLKTKLLDNIENARTNLASVNDGFSICCQKLADVAKNPWENPTLTKLIQSKDVKIGSKEREFFSLEAAYLISVRLKKLCENQCEDLALNLVTNFLQYKKVSEAHNFNLHATEKQLWYIFDIYIALLYKFQDKTKIIQQFEELELKEGLNLINRFAKKRVKISKIWRDFNKIAVFGSKFFLAKTLMKFTDDLTEFLTELIKSYLGLYPIESQLEEFILSIRNVTNLADASGLYVTCEIIHKQIGEKHRNFATEMYVRALTTDLNELECLKHGNEDDKVKLTTSRLARTFTNLADLLGEDVKVARECILTAFSLEPTKDRLNKIVELAQKCGYPLPDIGQEWKCKLHPPILPTDDIAWTCPECGEWMCKPELTAPLQMNMALHEALQESVLGISEALRDDLVVCLSNPRYQILSWLLPWSNLYRLCMMYHNDPEKTKNFITELKFVDVDYSMFQKIKREPVDEYTGIEKGYEQYLDLDFVSDEETSISEDSLSRYVGLGSDGEPSVASPQRKSDPTTLRSLRLFRPMIKRKCIEPIPCLEKRISVRSDMAEPTPAPSLLLPTCENEPYNYSIHRDRSTLDSPPEIKPSISNIDLSIPYVSYPAPMTVDHCHNKVNKQVYDRPFPIIPHVGVSSQEDNVLQDYTFSTLNAHNLTNLVPNSNVALELPNSVKTENSDRAMNMVLNLRTTTQPPSNDIANSFVSLETIRRFFPCTDLSNQMNAISNQFDVQSKNGVAATLLQLGGQVADNMRPSIQVPMKPHQMKLLQEMSLHNGTIKDYKKTLRHYRPEMQHKGKLSKSPLANSHKRNTRKLCKKLIEKSSHMSTSKNQCNHFDPLIHCVVQLMLFISQILYGNEMDTKSEDRQLHQLNMVTQHHQPGNYMNKATHKMNILTHYQGHNSINIHQILRCNISQFIPQICLMKLVYPLLELMHQEQSSPLQRQVCHLMILVYQRRAPPLYNKIFQCFHQKYMSHIILDRRTLKTTQQTTMYQKKMGTLVNLMASTKNPYPMQDHLYQIQTTIILEILSLLLPQYKITLPQIIQMRRYHLLPEILVSFPLTEERKQLTVCHKQGIMAIQSLRYRNNLLNGFKVWLKQLIQVNSIFRCPVLIQKEDIQKTETEMNEPIDTMDCSLENVCTELEKTDNNRISIVNYSNTLSNYIHINKEAYLNAVNNDSVIINRCSENHEVQAARNKPNIIENCKDIDNSMSLFRSLKVSLCRDFVIKNNVFKAKPKHSCRLISLQRKLKKMELQKFVDYLQEWTATCSKSLGILQPLNFPVGQTDSDQYKENETEFMYIEDDGEVTNKENQILTKDQNKFYQIMENAMDFNATDLEMNGVPFNSNTFNVKMKNGGVPVYLAVQNKIKKYSNTRKQQHLNVPCFKFDQDRISPKSKINHYKHRSKKLSCKIVYDWDRNKYLLEPNLEENKEKKKSLSPLLDSNRTNDKCQKGTNDLNTASGNFISRKQIKSILKNKANLNIPPIKKNVHFKITPTLKKKFKKSVFDYIPGLNDFSEVMPNNTEQVVNVVQVSGSRVSTATSPNIQTSTPVTPHIQRIGQPKISDQGTSSVERIPVQSTTNNSTLSVIHNVKPSTSQPSPLINILNSQIKPTPKASAVSRQTINILSQQIIRQPNHVTMRKTPKTATTTITTTTTTATTTPTPTTSTTTSNFRDQSATVIRMEHERNSPEVKTLNANAKVETATQTSNSPISPNSTQGGTILQLICRSSLPKFQQAFGKAVYQSNNSNERVAETVGASILETSSQSHTVTTFDTKKIAVPVNFPFTGNVIPIFKGQVPVGQTVGLIPQGTNSRQLLRITGSKHEQISLVKETVIQNKAGAFFSATLQGEPKRTQQNGELVEEYSATRITLCKARAASNAARITKPTQRQFPSNVTKAPQTNMSSTTLEQIREFDMVYNQVKQRSNNNSNSTEPKTVTHIQEAAPLYSLTYVNKFQKYTHFSPLVVVSNYNTLQQPVTSVLNVSAHNPTGTCLVQTGAVAVPKTAVKTACKDKNNKGSLTKNVSQSVPTIAKPQQQKPQEDEYTTQRIFDILAEYAEKLRNSPDLNNKPAPRRRSNPPTNPSTPSSSSPSKKKKKKTNDSSSSSVETDTEDLTMGSEDSSGGNTGQLSTTDEEQSQPATTVTSEINQESQMPNVIPRPLIVSDSINQSRNVIIANSNVSEALKMPNTALIMPGYIVPVSIVKGNQQIAVVSSGNKILATGPPKPGQNMLLVQSFVNQNKRANISAVKYSTLQPLSGIPAQTVTAVGVQGPTATIIPPPPLNPVSNNITLTQPVAFKKIEDIEKLNNASLLLAIAQPRDVIGFEAPLQAQPPPPPLPIISQTTTTTTAKIPINNIEVKLSAINQTPIQTTHAPIGQLLNNLQKTNSITTSVITSVAKKDPIKSSENVLLNAGPFPKVDQQHKQAERTNTILVNTSNGPMFTQVHPKFKIQPNSDLLKTEINKKEESSGNSDKITTTDMRINKPNLVYGSTKMRKKIDFNPLPVKKPASSMEKVLLLQKTLPDECKQLGVAAPSTTDLFPEVNLIIEPSNNIGLEQNKQDPPITDSKGKSAGINLYVNQKMNAIRKDADFTRYKSDVTSTNTDKSSEENNGTKQSHAEDITLLPNCHGNVAEVTLTPPLLPGYKDSNSHNLYKYKYKYCNRKKFIQQQETSTEKLTSESSASCSSNLHTNNGIENIKEINVPRPTLNMLVPEKEVYKSPKTSTSTITNTTTITPSSSTITQQVIKDVKGNYIPFNGIKGTGTLINKQNKLPAPLPNKKAYIIKKR